MRRNKHKLMVTVNRVVEIDPDRVEEYVLANYDPEKESIEISDLTEGDGVTAPVVYQNSVRREDLAWSAMDPD